MKARKSGQAEEGTQAEGRNPCLFHRARRLEIPPTNSRLIHGSASGAGGRNNGRNDGIAQRRKRVAAKWAAGSRSTS